MDGTGRFVEAVVSGVEMSDRKLIIGGTYSHCGGSLYNVLAEIKAKEFLLEGFCGFVEWIGFGKILVAADIKMGEQVAVYRKGDVIYVMEKQDFLKVLGKPTSQYYRFELVTDNAANQN
jgi:hypothetical protein